MRVKTLEVCNVGPFKALELEFKYGSVAIVGQNGAGKSTLMNLLYGALSNDWRRFAGKKEDLVRDTAGTKASAFVRVEVEHAGIDFAVRRGFRPSSQELTVADKRYTKDAEIQAELEKLGLNTRLLDFCVFKAQNNVYDFLSSTPGERAKAYQILNHTGVCEQLWERAGDLLRKAEGRIEEYRSSTAPVAEEVQTLLDERGALATRRDEVSDLELSEASRKSATMIVDAAKQAIKLDNQIAILEGDIQRGEKVMTKAEDEAAAAGKSLMVLTKAYEALVAEVQSLAKLRDQWSAYDEHRKRLCGLQGTRVAVREKLTSSHPPTVRKPKKSVQELQESLAAARHRLAEAKRIVAAFDDAGVTECPTCGTDVEDLAGVIAAKREAVESIPRDIDAIREHLHLHKAWVDYEASEQALRQRLAQIDLSLADMGEVAQPTKELPEGDDTRQVDAKKAERACNEAKLRDKEAAQALAKAEGWQDGRKKSLATLRKERRDVEYSEEVLQKAERRLAEHASAVLKRAEIDTEIRLLDRRLAKAREEQVAAKERQLAFDRLISRSEVLKRFREVVHKNSLPQIVAQRNLARMEEDINLNLEPFGDPFWVEADEALSFNVHFPGAPMRKAERLSAGQKTILAIAFWTAVGSLYASELGMLALDEPTANLDEANIGYLFDAVARLTDQVRGKRQILMVTHAEGLRNAFDQTIDLSSYVKKPPTKSAPQPAKTARRSRR